MDYFPCTVLLANGDERDCVYLVEATSYIRTWVVWPDDDPGKREIRVEEVARIQPSASRLPVKFARKMYAAGESGMGYCVFTLDFADGTRQPYCTGNLIDFPELPAGKSMRDVVAITPHNGRGEQSLGTQQYWWCLFSALPRKSMIQRLWHALRSS
jgi:hypothetical protein